MKPLSLIFLLMPALASCSSVRKIEYLRREEMRAGLVLPSGRDVRRELPAETMSGSRDTITVTGANGERMILMRAIRDDDGDMVASETLDAAVVTARFRNVAERHGVIDLEFDVVVPSSMQDRGWQLTFYPDMFLLSDSLRLDPIVITGQDYRNTQLRGYQQYERFLRRIVPDTASFVDRRSLEIFLQRSLPDVYALRSDTSFVSDAAFMGLYGVTEQDAVRHFTNRIAKRSNSRRIARRQAVYDRYVKSPILETGIRLDTVIREVDGDFRYRYVQEVRTRAGLKRIDVVLSGKIDEYGRTLYNVPPSEPLSFYVSSLSSFVDRTPRYRTEVVERRQCSKLESYLEFPVGSAVIDGTLGRNARELARLESVLRGLMLDGVFDIDSIVVTSFASPEGPVPANARLCMARAGSSVSRLSDFAARLRDSLARDMGVVLNYDPSCSIDLPEIARPLPFVTGTGGEHWTMLDALVQRDSALTDDEKRAYASVRETFEDPDACETALKALPFHGYMQEVLYPRLRMVKFDFHLSRKGMIKDTVHTTVLDTAYMRAVDMLADRDYPAAIEVLRPYADYNAALAYTAMDRNASAMEILGRLRRDARVNYLMALLNARAGDERAAVQYYIDSCAEDPSYVHRGNLDPEIAALIRKYDLNKEDDNTTF